MLAAERLRELLRTLPEGGSVTLTRAAIAEMVDAEALTNAGAGGSGGIAVDLTVPEVAELFNRSTSTVRGWLAAQTLPGAYRLHGREWRIPRSAIEAMQAVQRKERHKPPRPASGGYTDLGAWRKHVNPRDTKGSAV